MSTVPAILKFSTEAKAFALRRVADYWTLTKPEVNFLVLISALAGFYAASHGPLHWMLLAHMLVGTLLVASTFPHGNGIKIAKHAEEKTPLGT